MQRRTCAVLLALFCGALLACAGAPTERCPEPTASHMGEASIPEPGSFAQLDLLEQYAATYGFWLGSPSSIRPTPDGSEVLFLRSPSRDFTQSLYSFDLLTGQERVLLTAEQVLLGQAAQLSEAERERRERLRSVAQGITSYQLSEDGRRILVPLSGRLFVVERVDGRVEELLTGDGYPNDARFSPSADRVAYVVDGDLYVYDIAASAERRLTATADEHITNGLPGFLAQEEMLRYQGFWWSPDGAYLAYEETDISGVEVLHAFDPADPTSEPNASPFPRAGTTNPTVRLGVVSASGGDTTWITWDRAAFPYLATVRWPEAGPLTLVVQNRAQTEVRVLAADPATGETWTLHTETDEHWVNLDQDVPRWLDDGRGFLWTTERRGAWQLELRDAGGGLVAELTPLDWVYGDLVHVDEEAGVVWLRGGPDPMQTQVVRVPLDPAAGSMESVTHAFGVHGAVVGEDGETWVELARPFGGERAWIVRRGEERVGELSSEAELPPYLPDPELVTVGERGFYAAIIRPRDFEPGRRYPVLVSVYGGPSARVVRALAIIYLYDQWLADQGYIVVRVDGRGTTGRGRDWERAIAGNFVEVPLADQVAGLQALAAEVPEMDLGRVGIFGWSFGGYLSTMAVLLRPDVFHAAVAGAPVTEWREYDTHYTEHYLGLPDENPEGYERSSALTYAAELVRPLLIMHGMSDDNVYFTHAIRLSDALLRAGRPHELVALSGATHMVADPEMTRALAIRTAQFFAEHLQRP